MRAALVLAAGLIGAVACTDSKPAGSDTSGIVIRNSGEASRVDMLRIDSMTTKPGTPAPPAARPPSANPPAGVTGEARRESPPASRDPMPPLAGETNRRSGSMPVYRDSTSGPKMEIDSKGNIRPIKK